MLAMPLDQPLPHKLKKREDEQSVWAQWAYPGGGRHVRHNIVTGLIQLKCARHILFCKAVIIGSIEDER